MGGVANTFKKVVSNPIRSAADVVSGGLYEVARKNLPNNPLTQLDNRVAGSLGLNEPNSSTSYPFALDPNQVAANQAAINSLGQKQYEQTIAGIDTAGQEAQKYAGETLNRMIPDIEEKLNSQKLLNSTALQQEIGRQASNYSQDVASQQAQARLAALQPLQGFQSQALQRGLSLEDFITNANVAKTLGAQLAPQVNNGKANTGALLQGVGTALPAAKAVLK
jgi:hypothetical protein